MGIYQWPRQKIILYDRPTPSLKDSWKYNARHTPAFHEKRRVALVTLGLVLDADVFQKEGSLSRQYSGPVPRRILSPFPETNPDCCDAGIATEDHCMVERPVRLSIVVSTQKEDDAPPRVTVREELIADASMRLIVHT